MDDKIIVSNRSVLTAKYGAAGLVKIKKSVDVLIAADDKRGINSRLVYLDDAASMKKYKGNAVTVHTSPRQNKEAIDAIFRSAAPEYLMILGAIDVVPHQDIATRHLMRRMIRTRTRTAICPMRATPLTPVISRLSRDPAGSWEGCRI